MAKITGTTEINGNKWKMLEMARMAGKDLKWLDVAKLAVNGLNSCKWLKWLERA